MNIRAFIEKGGRMAPRDVRGHKVRELSEFLTFYIPFCFALLVLPKRVITGNIS
jgi:hypothetical protein